jgi:fatty acid desaturase
MTWTPLGLALLVCGVTWWRLAVVTRRLDRAWETIGLLVEAGLLADQMFADQDRRLYVVEQRRCVGAKVAERN